MKALVTGAGGFVGANLVRHLRENGAADPVALVRPEGDEWRLRDLEGEVEMLHVDLRDPETTERAVRALRPDVIFHLAAHGAYSWETDFDAMLAVNVRSTQTLIEQAAELAIPLVCAGTSSEYGYRTSPPAETERITPNSQYAVSKATATHLCELAAMTGKQHLAVLRLYSIYGPWENAGRLMPTLVATALTGGWPPLVSPEIARDFVAVSDACSAFVLAADPPRCGDDTIFNVASGVQTTLGELVTVVRDEFAVAEEPRWGTMPPRRWDTTTWIGNAERAEGRLGWAAVTSLRAGLRSLAAWLGDNPDLAADYVSRDAASRR